MGTSPGASANTAEFATEKHSTKADRYRKLAVLFLGHAAHTSYFREPVNANAAPCGSAAWTIQLPPGTC